MRFPGRGPQAILLTGILLISGCSSTPTAAQAQDGEVSAAPIATATPPVSPAEPAPNPDGQPGDPVDQGDGLTELEQAALQPSPLGIPSVVDRYALWTGPEFTARENELASIAYYQEPAKSTLVRAEADSLHRTIGLTPGGTRAWVNVEDPGEATTCPEGATGSVLATMPLDGSEAPRLAQPADTLPPNIIKVHAGPEDHVLLYSSCGHYAGPTAFARVTPEGDFTDVRPLHEVTNSVLSVYEPHWIWGVESNGVYDYDDTGRLVAVIPQFGISAPGDETPGPADIYIDVETGDILDIFPSRTVGELSLELLGQVGYDAVTNGELPAWAGPVWFLRDQPDIVGHGGSAVAVAGEEGALIATFAGPSHNPPPTVERISESPVTDVQWAPSGEALAISDTDGTRLIVGDQVLDLSAESGSLYFSDDGSTLVLASQRTHVFTFPPVEPPSDTNQVTAFSQLDSGGLGPIRIDMLVSELQELLGVEFTLQTGGSVSGPGACVWISSPALFSIWMLGEEIEGGDAIVKSLAVDRGPWSTPSGLRIGSTEQEIYDALNDQVQEFPHAYTAGSYLFFEPSDPNDPYGVKFESNGHEAYSITVGHHEWISFVEGCA